MDHELATVLVNSKPTAKSYFSKPSVFARNTCGGSHLTPCNGIDGGGNGIYLCMKQDLRFALKIYF